MGEFWPHDGEKRQWRPDAPRARDVHDHSFVHWLYGPTALTPDEEPPMSEAH